MLSVIFQVPRPQSVVIFIQILTLWIAEWPKQAQAIVVRGHKDMSRFARECVSWLQGVPDPMASAEAPLTQLWQALPSPPLGT